ncbi:pyocin knob domain-containing protein [Paenibacillus sp. OSY-SE]|uniref:pyocin knob domain-containing protein n=1 Tax=Paenibacillus sp. OSY-SE TaxID=1196323 RepID=UPI0002F20956|nr:pyocin knob domain-containing protein [Paenibacillus sp. OSY-SE]
MAENRNILIQDDQGNNYYPHGKAKTTFLEDGKTLESRAVAWDGKETSAGAQAKANQAEANTKGYVDGLQTITFAQKTSKNANLNDFKETGIFQLGASANYQNIPQNVDWTVLEVRCARGGYIIQTLTSVTSQRIMYRTRTETSWSIWRDVLTTLNYEELKQSGVDAKNKIAGAINAKGVPASANDTFDQLEGKIGQIRTSLAGNIRVDVRYDGHSEWPPIGKPFNVDIATLPAGIGFATFISSNKFVLTLEGWTGNVTPWLGISDSAGNVQEVLSGGQSVSGFTIDLLHRKILVSGSEGRYLDQDISSNLNTSGPIKICGGVRRYQNGFYGIISVYSDIFYG